MKSIWNDIKKPEFDALYRDVKTDVLIIGGGMCGILCAYMLKEAGVDCIIAESGEICTGITNGTTAKITLSHSLIYDNIIKKYGPYKAKLYYESQKKALEKLKQLALKADADFESCSNFVYSLSSREKIEKELDALYKIGGEGNFCDKTELPFKIAGAIETKDQGKFHPLKLSYFLAKDLNIYENTKVLELRSNIAITNKGRIFAKKIIVATHFPFINKYGAYFLKMYQHRSYVIAFKNAENIKNIYVDENEKGLSFRTHNDFLLIGGGSHQTGKKGGCWAEIEEFTKKYYPSASEAFRWATQDCMTLDRIPYIGKYSNLTPNLYVATGFNKWGMTSSLVSAMILTDMICEKKNEYEEVYLPSRTMMHPQFALNMIESVKNLVTLSSPRCPHLGCALKYNKEEHSWDCPCHGSRFDEKGKLLDNPATSDKK